MFTSIFKQFLFALNKKTIFSFLIFVFFISVQDMYSNTTEKTAQTKTGYTGFYKFSAEGKDLFVLSIIEYKTRSASLLKVTQKQSFYQQKSGPYLSFFKGTFAWATKFNAYVFYYGNQQKRFCQLTKINGQLVATLYEIRGNSKVKLKGLGSLKKIVNPRTQTTKNNKSGGPSIKGKYKLKNNNGDILAAFIITQSSNGVYVEEDTNSEDEIVDDKNGTEIIKALTGTFRWSTRYRCYRRNAVISNRSGYIELHGGNPNFLGIRKSVGFNAPSTGWGKLNRVQTSLSDLANSTKNNVSGITGVWTVENSSIRLTFTSGVNNDLLIRYGNKVYELNKLDGSIIESYQGTSRNGEDEITVKIISGTKMQLDLGDSKLYAFRKNSGNYKRNTTKSSGTTNTSMNSKLLIAIAKDDETAVEEVLNLGGSPNTKNAAGSSALHEAVLKNSSSIVEMLLAKGANINTYNNLGRSPLDVATQKMTSSNGEMVMLLLNKKATLSNYSIDQIINKNNVEIIDKMIHLGDKNYIINKAIEKGRVPLFRKMIEEKGMSISPKMFDSALRFRKYSIADVMISSGFDANYAIKASVKNNITDLVYTAMQAGGNADVALKYAIKRRDNDLLLEALDKHSANPTVGLKYAIASKNISMITTLLDKGAKPNSEISNVAVSGNTQILKLLIDKGADVNLGIVAAAKARKPNTVRMLLEAGADANKILLIVVNQGNSELTSLAIKQGATVDNPKLIQIATKIGNNTIVLTLIKAGANPADGVKIAVLNNKSNVLKTLVSAGAKVSDKSLLITSVKHNNTVLTGILLANGADPQNGLKPAVKSNAYKVLKQLITAGVDVTDQDLLNYSVVNNYTQCTILLIDENLDVNSVTGGYTLLHIAIKNKNYNIVKALLDSKANVNAISQGSSPLHLAVRNRREVAIVDALISKGADVNAKNSKGKKVLRLAKGRKIKKLLKKNGAVKK